MISRHTHRRRAQLPLTLDRLEKMHKRLQESSFKLPPVSRSGGSSSAAGPSQDSHEWRSAQGSNGELNDASKNS
jgi:hypothetical protein